MSAPAIVLVGPSGLEVARRIAAALPGSSLYGPASPMGEERAIAPYRELAPTLRGLFAAGRPIVGLCASGILIRVLAPLLEAKRAEPPVIAVAEDGSVAVPLLGGHQGANRLAQAIAGALDCRAAITTAGDVRFGLALDQPRPAGACAIRRRRKPCSPPCSGAATSPCVRKPATPAG